MLNRRQFLITTGAALAAAGLIVPVKTGWARDAKEGEIALLDQDGDVYYFTQLPNHGGYRCSLNVKDKWPKMPLIADSQEDVDAFARYGLVIEQPIPHCYGHHKAVFKHDRAVKDGLAGMEWYGFGKWNPGSTKWPG